MRHGIIVHGMRVIIIPLSTVWLFSFFISHILLISDSITFGTYEYG